MERQRLQPLHLEISESGQTMSSVRAIVPIVGKLNRPCNDRVAILQRRIRWIEDHYSRHRVCNDTSSKDGDLEALKQELAAILKEDARANKL